MCKVKNKKFSELPTEYLLIMKSIKFRSDIAGRSESF